MNIDSAVGMFLLVLMAMAGIAFAALLVCCLVFWLVGGV